MTRPWVASSFLMLLVALTGCSESDFADDRGGKPGAGRSAASQSNKAPKKAPVYSALESWQKRYDQTRQSIILRQRQFGKRYKSATEGRRQRQVMSVSRDYLRKAVTDKMFPYWYGTIWNYYGTTEKPRGGTIACGYFVTTVLKHSGFAINRYRLARMPSETMIQQLISEKHIKRFRASTFRHFLTTVRAWGDGVYLVGLDNHTGFIVLRRGKLRFVHSSYQFPFMVVNEDASQSGILKSSRYRVLGKLFQDDNIRSWLRAGS